MEARAFADRAEAGASLARLLERFGGDQVEVLAIPRGGVPVAVSVAERLGARLGVVVTRKVGAPDQPEYGIGAVSERDVVIEERAAAASCGVDGRQFLELAERERVELIRQVSLFRQGVELPELAGRTVILIDDGVATGITDRAALRAVRRAGASRVVLAVPVCPVTAVADLEAEADELVAVHITDRLLGVGSWYRDFGQVSDREVQRALGLRP